MTIKRLGEIEAICKANNLFYREFLLFPGRLSKEAGISLEEAKEFSLWYVRTFAYTSCVH